jgi:cellobiose phosphorylase
MNHDLHVGALGVRYTSRTMSASDFTKRTLRSPSGLTVELNSNGSLRRMYHGAVSLNLFVGSEIEAGPANIYLRLHGSKPGAIALLGPRSPTRLLLDERSHELVGQGEWRGVHYTFAFVMARTMPAWYWHVALENRGGETARVDLLYVQDIALAPYGAVRLNEYYVSQYVDHTPLGDETHGCVVASRQNQPADGKHPWCMIGSLRKAVSFATDALQVHRLQARGGHWPPAGVLDGLPGVRLQHEHSLVAIQDDAIELGPGRQAAAGFFGAFEPDHPAATSAIDLARLERILSTPEATATSHPAPQGVPASASLFDRAPLFNAEDLSADDVNSLFSTQRRHEEHDEHGECLSFFYAEDRHVVLRAKELRVLRPHGHMLRTGSHLTPDETALTSTTWMAGVFHSMLTQGHVSINRFLSTVHGYLALFRSHGQRVFVEHAGRWQLLELPSAYEMAPDACRWIYKQGGVIIEVRSRAQHSPHAMFLEIEVLRGQPTRFLISHHVALNGDDGSTPGKVLWIREGEGIMVCAAPESDVGRRFPEGGFLVTAHAQTQLESIGGDEALFDDGRSRQEPFLCLTTAPARRVTLEIQGRLVTEAPRVVDLSSAPPALSLRALEPPPASPHARHVERLAEIAVWFRHNALVHYLSPRGLEQYSGGGWGTRDVSQGPVELLLASGQTAPVRDLLLRVMAAQAPDGDWPQWFMFFERERDIRASDSHGDIVFWPVLALAQYLIATGDGSLLDERVPFFSSKSQTASLHSVWEHIERALRVIEERVIGGTALAAYGHGDWNDALQPADPSMRRFMCSAWTVTLHYQTLTTLARALRTLGRDEQAARFDAWAESVRRDFQRLLIVDDVLTGYVLFEPEGSVRYLLHPRDAVTGVRHSALAMIHGILEGLFTAEQLRSHLQLLSGPLSGPDGVRLFDRPLQYHGGPQRYFQRAESATYFGREIGLMYMHAHLRYAQALAHAGEAERFFHALCQANPIGLRDIVPSATLRQANCYYSSSDALFRDRYHASAEYQRVAQGTIELEGGWRVYSSGAGIAVALILRRFLGLSIEHETLSIDPVIPVSLNGLRAHVELFGKPAVVCYDIAVRGCGVRSVEINGVPLPIRPAANPYRTPGTHVARAAVMERLDQARNIVKISVA